LEYSPQEGAVYGKAYSIEIDVGNIRPAGQFSVVNLRTDPEYYYKGWHV